MSATPPDAESRQRRWIQRFMDGVPHLKLLGIEYRGHGSGTGSEAGGSSASGSAGSAGTISSAGSGIAWAELEMPFADQQVADPDYGIIASGAIFAVLDNAAGFAVHVARNELVPIATLDMRVDYLRGPAPRATVVGRATCYRLTRQIAFVRGVAHDGDPANPIANMAGTFMFTARPDSAVP